MFGQAGVQTVATVKDRGTFSCPRCRHWQRAEVMGVGIGVSTHLAGDGTARERARENASRDVRRTLRFATCPRCKHRSGHAAFVLPYVLASFAATAGAIVFAFVVARVKHGEDGAAAFQLYFPLAVAALTVVVTPASLLHRWRHNDARIRWLDF
ncbi:MAG: hypothetical protein JO257_31925 [Deltaproteobacteria bacterium]|nr:hypothetical protein [Deltaproteobacteria bacterium]